MSENTTEQKTKPNYFMIALSTIVGAATLITSYTYRNNFLADDVFKGRKSAESYSTPEILAARDEAQQVRGERNWLGRQFKYDADIRPIEKKIKETHNFSWWEAFKNQSGMSKAATITLVSLGIINLGFAIYQIVKPEKFTKKAEPPSTERKVTVKKDEPTLEPVSPEEAKVLEGKTQKNIPNHRETQKERADTQKDAEISVV